MHLVTNEKFFLEQLEALPQSREAKAYVAGVFNKFIVSIDGDMSNESIVLAYEKAANSGDFVQFQKIGDWVIWIGTFLPKAIESNKHIVETMGRLSYNACFRLMRRQWPVFEELADELPRLTRLARRQITIRM